jgi:hypothetical protein
MRRLATLIAVTSAAAMAVQPGVALANSVTFTLRGTMSVTSPVGDTWYLRNASRQVAGTAAFFCLQPAARCAWNFRFRSGSFDVKVRRPDTRSRVGVTAGIVDPTGGYAHDTGYVHIYFLTRKVARFTFHVKS